MTDINKNLKRTEEKRDSIPVRNKYTGGVCKECHNDFVDIELHYTRYPNHRK